MLHLCIPLIYSYSQSKKKIKPTRHCNTVLWIYFPLAAHSKTPYYKTTGSVCAAVPATCTRLYHVGLRVFHIAFFLCGNYILRKRTRQPDESPSHDKVFQILILPVLPYTTCNQISSLSSLIYTAASSFDLPAKPNSPEKWGPRGAFVIPPVTIFWHYFYVGSRNIPQSNSQKVRQQ